MRDIKFTIWGGGLYDISSHEAHTETWEQLTQRLSSHDKVKRKEDARGFSPVHLRSLTSPCIKHTRTDPHRCDAAVEVLSCAVLDADSMLSKSMVADVERCRELLREEGVSNHWYSSYSCTPEKPTYRLVIPFSRDVLPHEWADLRREIIEHYEVPCDIKKCSGLSHFYFLPSCPPHVVPHALTFTGAELDVDAMMPTVRGPRHNKPLTLDGAWTPPPEPTGMLVISEHLAKLRNRLTSLERSRDPRKRENALYLRRCLEGSPLAEHGSRYQAALVVTGTLVYALPEDTPLGVFRHIIKSSIEAMIRAGSKLTMSKVEHMILTSMRNRAAARQQEAQVFARQQQELKEYLTSIK